MATIKEALHLGREQLHPVGELALFEAELLLCHVLRKPRSHLFSWPEATLEEDVLKDYAALIHARAEGQPLAYLTGEREFWSLPLQVTPDTLIPRPETELLVERALPLIPEDQPWQLLDLGTGTGAIALALAKERPASRVTATDISTAALTVARDNAAHLSLPVTFVEGEWLDAVPGQRFDLIVSNPPYIPTGDPHLQQGDVRHEPASALVAGEDGLDAYRAILADIANHLNDRGWLLFEHGYDQAEAVSNLLKQHDFQAISSHRDNAGHERVTAGQYISPF